MDHRGECDEDDDTPSDDVCARVRDAGRCEYNSENCDRLVRPEEGCCPVCGKADNRKFFNTVATPGTV